MKKSDAKIDWTRARSLLDGMRSQSRRRLASQILLGKELCELKTRLNFKGKGANWRSESRDAQNEHPCGGRRSKAHNELLKSESGTWSGLCKKELGITRPTADRYIARFEKAAEFAKELPEAGNILLVPTAELDGTEIEVLASFVENLVDFMTREALAVELGLKMEIDPDDCETPVVVTDPAEYEDALRREAADFFSEIPRKIAALRAAISPLRDHSKYRVYLGNLPLEDSRKGMPSLLGIREGLESFWKEQMGGIFADMDQEISAKMSGKPKRLRLSPLNPGRK